MPSFQNFGETYKIFDAACFSTGWEFYNSFVSLHMHKKLDATPILMAATTSERPNLY
jgi:hypothetical protein